MGQESDSTGGLAAWGDIGAAFALLTRIPVPVDHAAAAARGARAAWAWPVAGAAVGAIAAGAGLLLTRAGLPADVAAVAVLAVQAMLTGALHEDGLADSADGLWGGRDRERRLAIMKDSRIGSFGVLALGLGLMARWAALAALIGAGGWVSAVVAAAAVSRVPMAAIAALLPPARDSGLSHGTGRPGGATLVLAAAVAAGLALPGAGAALPLLLLAVATVTLGWAALARARIGGQTGDILGAGQQLGEIAALCVLVAGL
jgi:adenosylcobinamide-GDP ribazoletransferase